VQQQQQQQQYVAATPQQQQQQQQDEADEPRLARVLSFDLTCSPLGFAGTSSSQQQQQEQQQQQQEAGISSQQQQQQQQVSPGDEAMDIDGCEHPAASDSSWQQLQQQQQGDSTPASWITPQQAQQQQQQRCSPTTINQAASPAARTPPTRLNPAAAVTGIHPNPNTSRRGSVLLRPLLRPPAPAAAAEGMALQHGLLPVVHVEPHWGKAADKPAQPAVFAGREFR
jgi:hypothetical protein